MIRILEMCWWNCIIAMPEHIKLHYSESYPWSLLLRTVCSNQQLLGSREKSFPMPAINLLTGDRMWDLIHVKQVSFHSAIWPVWIQFIRESSSWEIFVLHFNVICIVHLLWFILKSNFGWKVCIIMCAFVERLRPFWLSLGAPVLIFISMDILPCCTGSL